MRQPTTLFLLAFTLFELCKAMPGAAAPKPKPTPTPTPPPGSLSLTITNPAAGETIASDRYNVRGTFQGPANTGVAVNDHIAYTDGTRFIANAIALAPGANTITVVATAPDGTSTTSTVTVSASGAPPNPAFTADVSKGLAPLTVAFNYAVNSTTPLRKVTVDFDGDGRDDFRASGPPATGSAVNTYTKAGLYLATLTITDTKGGAYTANIGVEVDSYDAMDSLFLSVWQPMNDALVRGDVNGALLRMNSRAQQKYARVFNDLIADMPAIVASYSAPQRISTQPNYLEYAINRTIDGENQIFFVYLMRDADGVWRMDSM